MKKYLELVEGSFTQEHQEKAKPENRPYVAYSPIDGVMYTIILAADGYNLTVLKKIDISDITYEAVDLGLPSGLKWANKNVGAQTENDYGAYFSWGNTEGYTVSGTKFLTVDGACQLFSSLTGESISSKEELEGALSMMSMSVNNIGSVDNYSFDEDTYAKTTGASLTADFTAENDAATVNMSSDWRMPTNDEQRELINAVKTAENDNDNPLICQYEYLDLEGNKQTLTVYRNGTDYFGGQGLFDDEGTPLFSWIDGVRFKNVSTGASLFFPACGFVVGPLLARIGLLGPYWSSSINDTTSARYFIFNRNSVFAYNSNYRFYG